MAHNQSVSIPDGGAQRERVPHQIILPGDPQTAFSNSQLQHSKAPKISSHLPEIPPFSQPVRRSPPPPEPQAMLPSIPHPPRRTPNTAPSHRAHSEIRPLVSIRPQGSTRPQGVKAHLPTAQLPLTHQYANPLLSHAPLSPAQLHAQRQQLITAYMMQSGGAAGLAQPFLFPGGGVPVPPIPAPQGPQQLSPAPKYTEVEAIVAEMRENMLKVLKTANYKRCKSAKNIRQALRQVRTLCKNMRNETTEMGKQKVNPRKKAATPEGDEAPTKKQRTKEGRKNEEGGDTRKGEEAGVGFEDGESPGDADRGEGGADDPENVQSRGEGAGNGVDRTPQGGEKEPEQGVELGQKNGSEHREGGGEENKETLERQGEGLGTAFEDEGEDTED